MKYSKKILSLLMAIVMIITNFCAFGVIEIGAATTDTRYSKKYLQNGGFEENASSYTWSSKYTQPQKVVVPYWDTTAYNTTGANGKLEFFQDGCAHFNQSSTNKVVAEGEVAAELNADEVSTIYQRIETVSGSTYTWGLDHRGRDTTDTMVLFIGPEQYKTVNGVKTPVDPSKKSKNGVNDNDQFVKMTDWLKKQYGISYPATGCSQKYTVYSKPFDEKGAFQNEKENADENFSMTQTEECNQEWNLWVISSVNNNTSTDETVAVKGWSKYGTNCYDENDESYNDVIKGVNSKLGYDCTYTVPKGQTKTLFAFTSYSSGRLVSGNIQKDATYGNLLDDINFKLYQPISSSITEGGTGGASEGDTIISSDIQNGNLLYTTVNDGDECTIHTKLTDNKSGHTFQGAYVTVHDDAGNPTTKFVDVYSGDTTGKTDAEMLELSKTYFMPDHYFEHEGDETWDYFYTVTVDSPVHIHMMYTKAPYVLYDSNGGEPYQWTEDNSVGGNLIGFRDGFKGLPGVNSIGYYEDAVVNEKTDEQTGITILETIHAGIYKSHAALPNSNWVTNASGIGSRFCGWTFNYKYTDENDVTTEKIVTLDGNHTITYAPNETVQGAVTITDGKNNVSGLTLDATNGITLTAQWKFGYTAQAQTLIGHNDGAPIFDNSAVGGWVEETFITDRSNVTDYQDEGVAGRTERTDAYGSVGEKIIFRATADTEKNYAFDGWYTIDNGVAKLVSTTPNLAITVEQGKSETYYARFVIKTLPVIFHYSPTGSGNEADYVYYDTDENHKYGKYFQNVEYKKTAVQPTKDSESVKKWYTSPTERGSEYVFDFNTPILEETHLYASPSFAINYYTHFRFNEPWEVEYYATLKFKGNYIDVKSNPDLTDYNIYTLKANVGDTTPSASDIKELAKNDNSNVKTVSKNNSKILFNETTNTGIPFNRCGIKFNDFYLYNMDNPVYVVFDFTYKGITYTSSVKDRSLDQNITTYMTTENGLFTTLPTTEQLELRTAQTDMLKSIRAMKGLVDIYEKDKTQCPKGSSIVNFAFTNTENSNNSNFTVAEVAARYVEPWGYKFIFDFKLPDGVSYKSELEDYGAIVLTDKSPTYKEIPTVQQIIDDSNTIVYSKKNSSVSDYKDDSGSSTGKICAYSINDLRATDFDKNTYVVFYYKVKGSNYCYSEVKSCSYRTYASEEGSVAISKINDYSQKLINYYEAKKKYNINN